MSYSSFGSAYPTQEWYTPKICPDCKIELKICTFESPNQVCSKCKKYFYPQRVSSETLQYLEDPTYKELTKIR